MASRPVSTALPGAAVASASPVWRSALIVSAVLTACIVVWIGQHDPLARATRENDSDLLAVLRLMAAIKGGAAIALLWLAERRLRRPAPQKLAIGFIGAGMLMVTGPALIWTMAALGLGALAFYAGLAAMCMLLWTDRATILDMVGGLGRPRRR